MKSYPFGVGREIEEIRYCLQPTGPQDVLADRGRSVVRVPRDLKACIGLDVPREPNGAGHLPVYVRAGQDRTSHRWKGALEKRIDKVFKVSDCLDVPWKRQQSKFKVCDRLDVPWEAEQKKRSKSKTTTKSLKSKGQQTKCLKSKGQQSV